jgi:hypothetical protein
LQTARKSSVHGFDIRKPGKTPGFFKQRIRIHHPISATFNFLPLSPTCRSLVL